MCELQSKIQTSSHRSEAHIWFQTCCIVWRWQNDVCLCRPFSSWAADADNVGCLECTLSWVYIIVNVLSTITFMILFTCTSKIDIAARPEGITAGGRPEICELGAGAGWGACKSTTLLCGEHTTCGRVNFTNQRFVKLKGINIEDYQVEATCMTCILCHAQNK